ncbi:MAG TPA: ATP-dependent metallopeptidase FtsH/Yme1/Tma family protein, partial [Acidimicrobiales bacterium]|nr:ATP-dependent metallopeptidase FtsH/Yme1/Tma family protein [Acidimicrobiales bacterium]
MAVPPPPPPPPRRSQTPERGPDRPRGAGRPVGRPDGGWPRWTAWALIVAVLAVIVLSFMLPGEKRNKITYTDFMNQVIAGNVSTVTVNNDTAGITGTL